LTGSCSCSSESKKIRLTGVVLHLGTAGFFSVKIPPDEIVADLKDIIFEKNKNRLKVDAGEINVWKVS
jgi:hypothetical protein